MEKDVIGRLKKKVAELEGKFTTFSKKLETMFEESAKEVKSFREELEVSKLFSHQGMSNALQAFCDFVLVAFFKACGKEAIGFQERVAWLANHGAGEVFVTREAVILTLFGVEKKIGRREFQLIKALHKASSELSSSVCHSATPLEVAIALESEGASVFADDFKDICALFRVLFNVTSKRMVKDWKEGNLNEEFKKMFKPIYLPHI